LTDYSYKDRVKREHQELESNLARLGAFIGTVKHNALPMHEQARLSDQAYFMSQYSRILQERIDWFDEAGSREPFHEEEISLPPDNGSPFEDNTQPSDVVTTQAHD